MSAVAPSCCHHASAPALAPAAARPSEPSDKMKRLVSVIHTACLVALAAYAACLSPSSFVCFGLAGMGYQFLLYKYAEAPPRSCSDGAGCSDYLSWITGRPMYAIEKVLATAGLAYDHLGSNHTGFFRNFYNFCFGMSIIVIMKKYYDSHPQSRPNWFPNPVQA